MKTEQLRAFVANLEIAPPKKAYSSQKRKRTTQPGHEEVKFKVIKRDAAPAATGGTDEKPIDEQTGDKGFFNEKSLVSFAANVSPQNREDLLNSLLLSQLAGNKKFSEPTDADKWFTVFSTTMNTLGWVMEGTEISSYQTAGNVIEVESVVLDILKTALGGQIIQVAQSLITALGSLAKTGDKKFIAFENNTHSTTQGCFMLGVATETNNVLSFTTCMIMLTAEEHIKQILFFKSTKDSTTLKYASLKGTLNSIYGGIRKDVADKLGDRRAQFVAEIDI